MSDQPGAAAGERPASVVTELKVSGNLMTLDNGLFCIVNTPSGAPLSPTGLPGVRITLPPGPQSRPDAIRISSFREDGWLGAYGDAALVRVSGGPAQLLVTIYQVPGAAEAAPSLQVLRLIEGGAPAPLMGRAPGLGAPALAANAGPAAAPVVMDMVAHIQTRGDVGAKLGDWLGERGSKRWIEGFAIAPTRDVPPNDIEYQAVLGRGWLSPWVEGGQFCGSRGMALPVLGLRVRLRGASAEQFECSYSASFIDGTEVGPIENGEACESEALVAMEAFQVTLTKREPEVAKPKPVRARAR